MRSQSKSQGRLDFRKSDVLLVDDNQHSLDLLSQVLAGFRFRKTQSARSAAEARKYLATQPFDLIIIDAEMPQEDGFHLVSEIRSRPKGPNFTVPIVVVSSFTPLNKVARARDTGANMLIKKPISAATLAARIDWIARTDRLFVEADHYCGPDRRFHREPLGEGVEERRADALALTSTPDRALSQDDIDSLFG